MRFSKWNRISGRVYGVFLLLYRHVEREEIGILVVLVRKIVSGLIITSLVGCASAPSPVPTEKVVEPSVKITDKKKPETDTVEDKVTAISPRALYLLMMAEIAGQRQQYGVALDGYLEAAKEVDDPKIAERAAKIGLFLKNSKKTDEAVSLWLKNDSGNLEARKVALLSALRGSDKDVAVKYVTQILQDDPAGFSDTLMEMVRILEKDGNTEFIFDVMEDVATLYPEQSSVPFVQALLAGQMGQQDIALQKITSVLKLQPEWDKALVLHAQFAVQDGDFKAARKDIEKVLAKTPKNKRMKAMLAQIMVKDSDFDSALSVYEEILEDTPEDGDAQFSIALIHLQKKDDDKAAEGFEKLINRREWDAPASYYLGRIDHRKKKYERALVWFDKVTKGGYAYDAAMASISVLLTQEKYSGAETRIETLFERFPKQKVNTLMLKSEIYSAQKQHNKAFDVLDGGLDEFSDHRDMLYAHAMAAEKIDKIDLLEEDLLKIIKKNPRDANALNALGYTLVDKTTRYDEAEGYLQQAIQISPSEAVIIDSLGWLRFKQGKLTEAMGYLKAAYKKMPESEVAAHLVELLVVMGKKGEAKSIFDKAIKKSPDDIYLKKVQHLVAGGNN